MRIFSAGMPMQPYPRAQYPEGYSQSSTQSPAKTRVRNGPVLQSQTGGNFHRAFENIEKENIKLLKMLSLVQVRELFAIQVLTHLHLTKTRNAVAILPDHTSPKPSGCLPSRNTSSIRLVEEIVFELSQQDLLSYYICCAFTFVASVRTCNHTQVFISIQLLGIDAKRRANSMQERGGQK